MNPSPTDNVFRLAILQRYGIEAGEVLDRVEMTIAAAGAATLRTTVHVFAVGGSHGTQRCFAWVRQLDATTMAIETVSESAAINDAERAIRSRLRCRRRARSTPHP